MRSAGTVVAMALLLGALSRTALCDVPPKQDPKPGEAQESLAAAKLGQKISDFGLADPAGNAVTLYGIKDKQAVVVVFLSFECPVSTSYSTILADMAKKYAKQEVAFLGVCSHGETAAEVAKQAAEFQLGFPVLADAGGAAAAAFKARKTPEAFVVDRNFVLRYRGRIDDGFAARLKRNAQIKNHDLANSLDELLAGKPVSRPVTEAVGCPIGTEITGQRELAKHDGTQRESAVTYYRDVLPILQSHCQECHRPGQVGPFSLTTYKQAVNWAPDIKEYTASRQMPPWKISTGLPFHHDRRLGDKDLALLAAWVNGGTPEGDPAHAPAPMNFTDGWKLGTPDLVLTAQEDFVLGPGGRDVFRVLVLPTDLPEDKFVVAYEVKPGNPRIVHHTINFIDTTGRARKLEQAAQEKEAAKKDTDYDRGPGYSVAMGVGFFPQGTLGGWAPGQRPQPMPEGYGFRLPKGADVAVQVHYHRNGRVERDRLKMGLYFAKKTEGMQAYKGGVIAGRFIIIPAGDKSYKVTGSTTVTQECLLHSVMPHMHLLGRQIKVTLKPPNEEQRTLLAIDAWDYNWQETYFLKQPLALHPGTVLEVEAVYDNSESNPNNPHSPPRWVTFGEQTTNEMCFVFLGATSEGPGLSPFGRPRQNRRRAKPEEKSAAVEKRGAEKRGTESRD